MLLQIKPITYEGLDCTDAILLTMATYYSHEYGLSFAQTWRFDYMASNNSLTLGDRIVQSSNTYELLKKYHNIELKRCCVSKENLLNDIIRNINRGIPVGISLDPFWTPWHASFKAIHGSHAFIIIGYDESNGLICIDPYYLKENLILTLEQLLNGYIHHASFNVLVLGSEDRIVDWRRTILNNLNSIYGKDFTTALYNNIQAFANEILDNFNIEIETKGYEVIERSPIIWNLAYVMINRKRYSCMLNYLGNKYSVRVLKEVAEKLEASRNYWCEVRGVILKAYFNNSPKIKARLYEKIMEIASFEANISLELISACNICPK